MRQPRLGRPQEATVQVVAAESATQERVPEAVATRATPVGLAAGVPVVAAHREAWPRPAGVRRAERSEETDRAVQQVDVVVEQPVAVARAVQPLDAAVAEQPVVVARAVPLDVAVAEQPVAVARAVQPADVARVEPLAATRAAVVEAAVEPAAHRISA